MSRPGAANGSSIRPLRQPRGAPASLLAMLIALSIMLGGCARGSAGGADAGPVYAALGASDAVGIGAARPTEEGWVPIVAAGLPGGTALLNLGVSGATVADMATGQLPVAIDADPRWVTIWPGPNDFRNGVPLDQFAAGLDGILATLRPAPGETRLVAVLNLPDLRTIPSFARGDQAALDGRVREWNGAIAAAVERHRGHAILVDLYGGWTGLAARPEDISADGFHPSSAGYRRVAALALATLRANDSSLAR